MLGACHVMACVLWYVGTYNLPPVWLADNYEAGTDATSVNNAANYQALLANHWLGSYTGIAFSLTCLTV